MRGATPNSASLVRCGTTGMRFLGSPINHFRNRENLAIDIIYRGWHQFNFSRDAKTNGMKSCAGIGLLVAAETVDIATSSEIAISANEGQKFTREVAGGTVLDVQ